MADRSAYVGAYKSGVCWWRDLPAGRVAHQLSFGGKDSTLHWKVYYKSLEIAEAEADAKKDYISDMWADAGLDVDSVWRCEVSIAGSKSLQSLEDGKPIRPRLVSSPGGIVVFCMYRGSSSGQLNTTKTSATTRCLRSSMLTAHAYCAPPARHRRGMYPTRRGDCYLNYGTSGGLSTLRRTAGCRRCCVKT